METESSPIFTKSWDAGGNLIAYQEPWGEAGAFTTLRFEVGRNGKCLYLFERHIERLFRTFESAGWTTLLKKTFVENCIKEFIKTISEQGNYNLRVMLSDVILSIRIGPRQEPKDLQAGLLWDYTRSLPELKTLDYRDILDALKTIDRSSQELLLVSEDGRLLEGATSCLLFCNNDQLIVPKNDRLDSITLKFVLELLNNSMEVIERDVHLDELNDFDEILLCGSGKGVVSLGEIEELEWKCRSLSLFRRTRILYDNAMIDYKYTWM